MAVNIGYTNPFYFNHSKVTKADAAVDKDYNYGNWYAAGFKNKFT